MPQVIEAVESTDAALTDRVEAQKEVTNHLQDEIQNINSFRDQLTEVQNMSTDNIKALSDQVQSLKDTKIRLEERIETIEKDKIIMEKQVTLQNNWRQYEEINFDNIDDDEIYTEEIDIELKREEHTVPEDEPEEITSNDELNI